VGTLTGVNFIAAGDYNSAAIVGGRVYLWGANERFQSCGADETQDVTDPAQVTSLEMISSVSLGSNFGIAVTDSGYAYAWGEAKHGQLGIGIDTRGGVDYTTETGFDYKPVPVYVHKGDTFNADTNPDLQSVLNVDAGKSHVLIVRADGFVYALGKNTLYRLGTPDVALDKIRRAGAGGRHRG
jgi:alpha-tubulin suppressor-like RCC1 family protein